MRITSQYQNNTAPPLVARWESHAEHAKSDEAAQVQLTYDLLLQLRVIKLLLIVVLVVIPIVAIVLTVVLTGASDTGSQF